MAVPKRKMSRANTAGLPGRLLTELNTVRLPAVRSACPAAWPRPTRTASWTSRLTSHHARAQDLSSRSAVNTSNSELAPSVVGARLIQYCPNAQACHCLCPPRGGEWAGLVAVDRRYRGNIVSLFLIAAAASHLLSSLTHKRARRCLAAHPRRHYRAERSGELIAH